MKLWAISKKAYGELTKDKWRWVPGRQKGGYDKFVILVNPFFVPFDCILLRFPENSEVKQHKDIVPGRKHYRFNIYFRRPTKGGEFICENQIFKSRYLNIFRSDDNVHALTKVESGNGYMLTIGWTL